MMRQPTPIMRLLAWHRAFMRGEDPAIHDGMPEPGWYKMQARKNGPWIPVVIWCHRDIDEHGELTSDEVIRAEVWGEEKDAESIWTYLTPISKKDYNDLLEYRLGNQHRLNNDKPIDLGASPTLPTG